MKLLTIRNRHFHSVQHKNCLTSRGANIQIKDSLPKHFAFIQISLEIRSLFHLRVINIISCLFHLSKQPLLIGEIFIVLKSVVHMLIFVTQCSSSFDNFSKETRNTGEITKLSAGPLRDEIFAPRLGTAQPN